MKSGYKDLSLNVMCSPVVSGLQVRGADSLRHMAG